jgi:hypothetical protein
MNLYSHNFGDHKSEPCFTWLKLQCQHNCVISWMLWGRCIFLPHLGFRSDSHHLACCPISSSKSAMVHWDFLILHHYYFLIRVFLCSPSWPWTFYVVQAGLEFLILLTLPFWVLGLQAHTTLPSYIIIIHLQYFSTLRGPCDYTAHSDNPEKYSYLRDIYQS